MAYFEDLKKRLGLDGATSGTTSQVPAGTNSVVAAKAPTPRGSGFVNLQRYLELNRGGGDRLGTELAGGTRTKAQGVEQDINSAKNLYERQATQGTVTQGAATSQSPEQLRAAAAQAGYSGPNALSDVADTGSLSARASQVAQESSALQSDAGRRAMLAERNGSQGTYARGLDSALAGNAAGRQGAALERRYGGLEKLLGDTEGWAQQRAQTAREASDSAIQRMQAQASTKDWQAGTAAEKAKRQQEELAAANERRRSQGRQPFTSYEDLLRYEQSMGWRDAAGNPV